MAKTRFSLGASSRQRPFSAFLAALLLLSSFPDPAWRCLAAAPARTPQQPQAGACAGDPGAPGEAPPKGFRWLKLPAGGYGLSPCSPANSGRPGSPVGSGGGREPGSRRPLYNRRSPAFDQLVSWTEARPALEDARPGLEDSVRDALLAVPAAARGGRARAEIPVPAPEEDGYKREKLKQIHDLSQGAEGSGGHQGLEQLQKRYPGLFPGGDASGGPAADSWRSAELLKLLEELPGWVLGPGARIRSEAKAELDAETLQRLQERLPEITARLAEIAPLRKEALQEASRLAELDRFIAELEPAWRTVLDSRRMLEILMQGLMDLRKANTAKNLQYSIQLIEAAQKAIREKIEPLIEKERQRVKEARKKDKQGRAGAQENLGMVDQWRAAAQKTLKDDDGQIEDLRLKSDQAKEAVQSIEDFRNGVNAFLKLLDDDDKHGSVTALAEYQRRQKSLPQLVEERKNGRIDPKTGKMDPDFRSLKSLQEQVGVATGTIRKIDEGLDKIPGVPIELAGVLVILVPNVPEETVHNPQLQAEQVVRHSGLDPLLQIAAEYDARGGRRPAEAAPRLLSMLRQGGTPAAQTKLRALGVQDASSPQAAPTLFGALLAAEGSGIKDILRRRRAYWLDQRKDFQKNLDEVLCRLDDPKCPTPGLSETDGFGDSNPISLNAWQRKEEDEINAAVNGPDPRDLLAPRGLIGLSADIDKEVLAVNAVGNPKLRTLSELVNGRNLKDLQDVLQNYAGDIARVAFPQDGSDAALRAQLALLRLARRLPNAGRLVIHWSRADGIKKTIEETREKHIKPLLGPLQEVVRGVDALLADIGLDEKYVAGLPGTAQGDGNAKLKQRKTDLLRALRVSAEAGKNAIEQHVLPIQRDAVDSVRTKKKRGGDCGDDDDKCGQFDRLFQAQIDLYDAGKKAGDMDVPWALASNGAPDGQVGQAHQNIQKRRGEFSKFLDNDKKGEQKGIIQFQQEVARREQTDCAKKDDEDQFGEQQPFSLVCKIERYGKEKADQAKDFNAQARKLKDILAKIDQLLKDNKQEPFDLATNFGDKIPTDAGPDDAPRLQRLVDDNTFLKLKKALTRVGDKYRDASLPDLGNTGAGKPPSKDQPDIDPGQRALIALNAKDAGAVLVPTSAQNPKEAALTFALLRYLYADGVVSTSRKAQKLLPGIKAFLNAVRPALEAALGDLDKDDKYVDDRKLETGDQVLARKIKIFTGLRDATALGIDPLQQKRAFDLDGLANVDKIRQYYQGLFDIEDGGVQVSNIQLEVLDIFQAAVDKTYNSLEQNRRKFAPWVAQLTDPRGSIFSKLGSFPGRQQEQTEALLRQNLPYQELQEQRRRLANALQSTLGELERRAAPLWPLLDGGVRAALPAELGAQVEGLDPGGGGFLLGPRGGAVGVLRKSRLLRVIEGLLADSGLKDAGADPQALQQAVLGAPQLLSRLASGSKFVPLGAGADDFYLVYRTGLSAPGGVDNLSSIIVGNIKRVLGGNLSLVLYQFAEQEGPANPASGGKGLMAQLEILRKRIVSYTNLGLTRDSVDFPDGVSLGDTAKQSRGFLFEDFAAIYGRLYLAATGFGERALYKPGDHPSFYGGSLKASFEFSPGVRLEAQEERLLAHDPRWFRQRVNLDFTGNDPGLDEEIVVEARARDSRWHREIVKGVVDLARRLGYKDAFTVDLHFSRQGGTEDFNQGAAGFTVLKDFTVRDKNGEVRLKMSSSSTGEWGTRYPVLSQQLSAQLPGGVAFKAEGKLAGAAGELDPKSIYYLELSRRTGAGGLTRLWWGQDRLGAAARGGFDTSSSFSWDKIFSGALRRGVEDLGGGDAVRSANSRVESLLEKEAAKTVSAAELRRVFRQDVGRGLLTQELGGLARELGKLREAGNFWANARSTVFAGYTLRTISNITGDEVYGGGTGGGVRNDFVLRKTQKEKINERIAELFRQALLLQRRYAELVKDWQEAVTEIAAAQWQLRMAEYAASNLPESFGDEAQAGLEEARKRWEQSRERYNKLTGKPLSEPLPFGDLTAGGDMEAMAEQLRRILEPPAGLAEALGSLSREQLEAELGPDRFNLADYLPWVEQLVVFVGGQIRDALANQALGAGLSLRLPIYDPESKAEKNAYVLNAQAEVKAMEAEYRKHLLMTRAEGVQARFSGRRSQALRAPARDSALDLTRAIPAYRNGLIPASGLRQALQRWQSLVPERAEALLQGVLQEAWSRFDSMLPGGAVGEDAGLDPASLTLEELDLREKAAEQATSSKARRVGSVHLEWTPFHGNATVDGLKLPNIGITGIGVALPTPLLRLRNGELKALEKEKGGAAQEQLRRLRDKVEAESELRAASDELIRRGYGEALRLLQGQLLPEEAQRSKDELELAVELASSRGGPGRYHGKSAESILEEVQGMLASKDPVGADRAILEARVRAARAVESIARKDLSVETLRVDPFLSWGLRSLGMILGAFSGKKAQGADPEAVEAARLAARAAEQEQDGYEQDLEWRRALLGGELALAESKLAEFSAKADAQGAIDASIWKTRRGLLLLQAAALGVPAQPRTHAQVPNSWGELSNRLEAAVAALAPPPAVDLPPELQDEEDGAPRVDAYSRFYGSRQSLSKVPIGKDYLEWGVELRLRSRGAPETALLEQAELRRRSAERLHAAAQADSRARGGLLAAAFELDARLLRWAESAQPRSPSFESFAKQLRARLQVEATEIAALLRLPLPPEQALEALLRLAPAEDAAGLEAHVQSFLDGGSRLQAEGLLRALYPDNGAFAVEELESQLRAEALFQRMQYRGFTPVLAFGLFRAKESAGLFFEAPDPTAIQDKLGSLIFAALRQDQQAEGRLRAQTLRLHLLFSGVSRGTLVLQKRLAAERRAKEAVRAQAALIGSRSGDPQELLSALQAWLGSWEALRRTAHGLQEDFLRLVEELEALGQPLPRKDSAPPLEAGGGQSKAPADAVPAHLSRRLLDDADFARRFFDGAKGLPGIEQIEAESEKLRGLVKYAKEVSGMDIPAAEKLDLLSRADLEGRRERIQKALSRLPLTEGLLPLLREDMERGLARSRREREEGARAFLSAQEADWSRLRPPAALQEDKRRLDASQKRLFEARHGLTESYGLRKLQPTEYLQRDKELDGYLLAQLAYDQAVVALLRRQEVAADPALKAALERLYDGQASESRLRLQKDLGRGALAMVAMMRLEEARLAALRREGAPPEDARVRESEGSLALLRGTLERWLRQGPGRELEPLYAVLATDGSMLESRTWGEIEALRRLKKVKSEGGGEWIQLESGKWARLSDGVDAAEAGQREVQRRTRQAGAASSAQEKGFALMREGTGELSRVLTFEELASFESNGQGRLFYFRKAVKPGGPEPALRLDQALDYGPEQLVIVVYEGPDPPDRRRFHDKKSLDGHLSALESSGDARARAEAARFSRVLDSEKGLGDWAASLERAQQRQLRVGWLEVKTRNYGFLRGPDGGVAERYRTEGEFRRAAERLARAPRRSRELERSLAELEPRAEEKAEAVKRLRLELQRDEEQQAAARAAEPGAGEFIRAGRPITRKLKAFEEAKEEADQLQALRRELSRRLEEEKAWAEKAGYGLFRSADLALGQDAQGALVSVRAEAVHGGAPLSVEIGKPQGAVSEFRGELYGASVDKRSGNPTALYKSREEVVKASKEWQAEGVGEEEGAARERLAPGSRELPYDFRLHGYLGAQGREMVLLHHSFDERRVEKARERSGGSWTSWLLPWKAAPAAARAAFEWMKLTASTPVELVAGWNQRDDGWLGRKRAERIEGGTTRRRNAFTAVLQFLGLRRDPVQWAFDPGQQPGQVTTKSWLKPGNILSDGSPHAGKLDVHLGSEYHRRAASDAAEDAENSSLRGFGLLGEGAVERAATETRRSPGRSYRVYSVAESTGTSAVADALEDSGAVLQPFGQEEVTVARQGRATRVETAGVLERISVTPGAGRYGAAAARVRRAREALRKKAAEQGGSDAAHE